MFGSLFNEEYALMLEIGYEAWKKRAARNRRRMKWAQKHIIPAMARSAAETIDRNIVDILLDRRA